MAQSASEISTTATTSADQEPTFVHDRSALLELFGDNERNRELIDEGLGRFSNYDDCRQRAADWIVTMAADQDNAVKRQMENGGNQEDDYGEQAAARPQAQNDGTVANEQMRVEKMARLMEMFPDATDAAVASALRAADDNEMAAVELLLREQTDVTASSSSSDTGRTAAKRKATAPTDGATVAKRIPGSDENILESDEVDGLSVDKESSRNPAVVLRKVQEIVVRCPDIGADAVYARLDKSEDVDATAAEIIREYDQIDVDQLTDETEDQDQPGPSGIKNETTADDSHIPQAMRHFITDEARADITEVITMFPDVDPHFVVTELVENGLTKEAIIDKMMAAFYPKYKERLEKERKEKRRNDLLNQVATFDIAEFLRIFDNPEAHFSDITRPVTSLYVQHARVYLTNLFSTFTEPYINRVLQMKNNHLLPTIRALSTEANDGVPLPEDADTQPTPRRRTRNPITFQGTRIRLPTARTDQLPWPETLDEQFFRELHYHHYREDINAHLARERERKERDVEKARDDGTLQECLICADDQCLPADMMQCTDEEKEHRFCRNCVGQHADERISDGAHRVSCMHAGCECEYTTDSLRLLIRPKQMNTLLRRMTSAQVQAANLQGIEGCPFCDFAVIIENDADKIFKCQNQDCLKESCRECKKDSHIPFRCDEKPVDLETAMRKDIELAMSNALIRTCPGCKKQIIKTTGCNHMTCPCGTHMCYVCGEQMLATNPFKHFADSAGKCNPNTSVDTVHANMAAAAGEAAKKKWLENHGNLMNSDIDIEKMVDRVNVPRANLGRRVRGRGRRRP